VESLNSLEPGKRTARFRRLVRRARTPTVQPLARSSGQALVEFALVAPLFLLMLFGVVEFSLINASIGTFNFAAKDAARYGAIIGRGSPPTPNQATPLDVYIVNNIIAPRVAGVVVAQMTQVEIFDASQTGGCAGGGSFPCATKVDILRQSGGSWVSTSNSWPTTQRNDQLANADYLGVRISYTYTYLTAFFAISSPTINLNALSVQRIEPQQFGQRQSPSAPIWASVHPSGWTSALISLSAGDFIDQDRRALRDWLGGRA
jgi:hypothetical protein